MKTTLHSRKLFRKHKIYPTKFKWLMNLKERFKLQAKLPCSLLFPWNNICIFSILYLKFNFDYRYIGYYWFSICCVYQVAEPRRWCKQISFSKTHGLCHQANITTVVAHTLGKLGCSWKLVGVPSLETWLHSTTELPLRLCLLRSTALLSQSLGLQLCYPWPNSAAGPSTSSPWAKHC